MTANKVYNIAATETTNQALRRLGFERVACDCSRCRRKAFFERRRTVRISDGVEALPCGTAVATANEWIQNGCPMN